MPFEWRPFFRTSQKILMHRFGAGLFRGGFLIQIQRSTDRVSLLLVIFCQKLRECFVAHWLDKVLVETRISGLLAVFFTTALDILAGAHHGVARSKRNCAGIRHYRLPNRLALAVARECIGMSPRWASRAAAPESCAVVAADCVMVRTSFACRAMA